MRFLRFILATLLTVGGQAADIRPIQNRVNGERPRVVAQDGLLFEYHAGDSLAAATFTRASTATYRDVAGVLQTASSGVARDNHYALDPVSGLHRRSLLMEGQRTNIALRSQEFDDAAWTKQAGVTITANTSVAPDGTATADRYQNTSGSANSVYDAVALATATSTFSIYAKTTSGTSQFRLRTGGSNISGDLTATTDWQRFSHSAATVNGVDVNCSIHTNAAFANVDIQIWGAQVETGFPSSYTPTTTATVTRAADSLSFPFTAVPQEMTVFVRGVDQGGAALANAALVALGTTSAPYLAVQSAGANQTVFHHNGTTERTSALASGVNGNSIENRVVLGSDGKVQLFQSINGAAETSGALSAANTLQANWSAGTLYVGNWVGASQTFAAFRDIIIAKGIRDLAYFRARIAP